MDFGCALDGYWSDITRLCFTQDLDRQTSEAYEEVVCAAYDAAFAVLRSGVPCGEVDRAAREVIEGAGYGDDLLHHEEPYLKSGNDKPHEVGHVFSIEPGIHVGGRFGVRFENIVHLGPDGPEPMNASPRKYHFKVRSP